jgi:integrase/recombinase XerD
MYINQNTVIISEDTIEKAIKKFHVKRIKFALSQNQIDELLSIAIENNYKYYLIIRLMLETGLRVSEVCNLRIENLNFKELELIIQSYTSDRYCQEYHPKTISGNRIVPITKELALELRRFNNRHEKGYVFLSQKGKNKFDKTSIIRFINDYARKCTSIQKTIGSHSLRRTYASKLAKENIAIGKISRVLGHKDIKTTLLYLYDIEDKNFNDIRELF